MAELPRTIVYAIQLFLLGVLMTNKMIVTQKSMKHIKKALAIILAGVFLSTNTLSWAKEEELFSAGTENKALSSGSAGRSKLAPSLRLNSEEFKTSLTVAAICKHIERDGNLDDKAYLNDVLARLDAGKNSNIALLPYEIIIEIPNEGLAVRYFDPTKANVITPYSDISKLSTKVIGPRLNRQVIHRTQAIVLGSIALIHRPELFSLEAAQHTDENSPLSRITKSSIKPRAPPSLVEIEISNFCNLKCEICERGNPDYIQKPVKHMSLDEFKKIINSYDYPIEKFQFCGVCEPTTNPHLVDMVKYVVDKKKPKVVELITNGTLLTPALSERLLAAGLTMLSVSLDGSSEEPYQAIRHHALAPVVSNSKAFAKAAKGKNIYFGINYVITKSNIDDVQNMPKFAHDIGVNALEFRIFETNLEKLGTLAVHDIERLKKLSIMIRHESEQLGITCNFWDFEERATLSCNLITEAHISYEGYLTPCYHLSHICIGEKLGDKPFSTHWGSEEVEATIENIRREAFLPECACLKAIHALGKSRGTDKQTRDDIPERRLSTTGAVSEAALAELADKMYFFGNTELAKLWARERAEVKGINEQEFAIQAIEKLKKAVIKPSRYPMLPEEMWVYMLPMLSLAIREGRFPIFIERSGCMFESIWKDLIVKLKEKGLSNLSDADTFLSVNVKRPIYENNRLIYRLERTINTLLTLSERKRVIEKPELEDAVKGLLQSDRNSLERFLQQKGLNGGINDLAGMSLERVIAYVVDFGVDERFVQQQDRLQKAYNLFRKYVGYLQESNSFAFEDILNDLKPFLANEEISYIREKVIKRIHLELTEPIKNMQIVNAVGHIVIGAIGRSTPQLRGTLKHKVRPLLNCLLKNTAFAKKIKGRYWIAMDDGIATGSTPLSLELLAKCFDEKFDYRFCVFYIADEDTIMIADEYSVFREIHPFEDAIQYFGFFFYEVEKDGIVRIVKESFDEYAEGLKRLSEDKKIAQANASLRLKVLNKKIEEVIDKNMRYLEQDLKYINFHSNRPPLNFWLVLVKKFLRRDSTLFDFLVSEYFMDYETRKTSHILRSYLGEVNIVLDRLKAFVPIEIITEYENLWPYDELEILKIIQNERHSFVSRTKTGIASLDNPIVLDAVKQYLENPNRNSFNAARKKVIPNILSINKPYSIEKYLEFENYNEILLREMLNEKKQDILLRIPIEAIEFMSVNNIKYFLETFQKAPNGYIELYYMSGIGEVSESIYQKYGLQKKPLPKDFKRTRENTVTLFPALKGEEINQSTIVSRLGSLDVAPENTILSPIGLQHDPAGLIRATILGLKIMDIARQIKDGKPIDKDAVHVDILNQLRDVLDPSDFKNFDLTPEDIIALATGNINSILSALKKLIKLLPIMPINAEELGQIYEHTKAVITAA